jgi:hypothetical protein
MRKKKLGILGTIVAALIMILALAGCSEAEVSSTLTIYSDLSGTKKVVIRVYGDEESLGGRDYTAGNNTAFMLTQGEALAEKLKDFCALEDAVFTVAQGKSNKDSTYVTMKFDFENIDDYNAKAKKVAGKYAESWIDATLTQSGDFVTVREAASNLPLLYLDLLEQYFNDFDCYPVYEYGPNTQSQIIPNGIKFQGNDMYSFTWWIVPTSAKIVVGSESSQDVYFRPEENYEHREDLTGKFTEATGIPAARPTVASVSVKEGMKTEYKKGETFAGGTLVVTYSDDSFEEIPMTSAMLSGFDTASAGEKTVTVTYAGKTVRFSMTVTEPQGGSQTPEPPSEKPTVPVWGYLLIALGCVLAVGAVTAVIMWRKKK